MSDEYDTKNLDSKKSIEERLDRIEQRLDKLEEWKREWKRFLHIGMVEDALTLKK